MLRLKVLVSYSDCIELLSQLGCLELFERNDDAILTRDWCCFVVRPHTRPIDLS